MSVCAPHFDISVPHILISVCVVAVPHILIYVCVVTVPHILIYVSTEFIHWDKVTGHCWSDII
jgi:hypothetical protein